MEPTRILADREKLLLRDTINFRSPTTEDIRNEEVCP